jgi:hypothetical protein
MNPTRRLHAYLPRPCRAHHRPEATIWGFDFPTTRILLDGGLSVGAPIGPRFPLAGLMMFVIIRGKGIYRSGVA